MAKKKSSRKKANSAQGKQAGKRQQKKFASLFPGLPPDQHSADKYRLPEGFARCIHGIENEISLPVWLLVQSAPTDPSSGYRDDFNMIGHTTAEAFFSARHADLKEGQKVALIVDSGGGIAMAAYEIAMLLRRHCGGFVAIVPRRAKSAATLLTLGADSIVMGRNAELGPLDVQIFDPDREETISGLDEVQALERLQAFAMEAADRMMIMLLQRTGKSLKSLLPTVTEFVASLTNPMFEGIDVVRYTKMSRLLKVAEEYGKRLLQSEYGNRAEEIASTLVSRYPEHGFAIYPPEAREIGLKVHTPEGQLHTLIEELTQHLSGLNAIGNLQSTEG